MNFSLPFKHVFQLRERSSTEQLALDFGEFPPFPLTSRSSDKIIRIVRASGVGEILNCFQISRKLFRIGSVDTGAQVSFSIRSDPSARDGMEIIDALNAATRQFSMRFRPLAARIFRTALVVWYSFVLARIIRRRDGGLGLFFPTDDTTGQITLTGASPPGKAREEALLSHEHLHFLQHRDGEEHVKLMKNPSALIPENSHGNRQLLYILEKREVEARLHEIVVMFYRANRSLPLSTDGFIELLSTSRSMRDEVMEPLRLQGYTLGMGRDVCEEREAMFALQLATAFAYMTDSSCEYRFITEVLTVMYGNLLRYYGDRTASQIYLDSIRRPNLYDVLYGPEASARMT